ncbi:hypothetical protein ABZP36_007729 [Zizania latifolia]
MQVQLDKELQELDKRLQQKEVSELKKKQKAQQQLLRQKQKSDDAAKRLQEEIHRIKSQKVLQQKTEEAAIAMKRLKELLEAKKSTCDAYGSARSSGIQQINKSAYREINNHHSLRHPNIILFIERQNVYPADQQMLIHQGKILKDDTTLEGNKVAENNFLVIMLSKAKGSSSGASTASKAPVSQEVIVHVGMPAGRCDLEAKLAEVIKASPEKAEKNCLICHLGLKSTVAESGSEITLGCSCKADLSYSYKQCALTWFKIRGNKYRSSYNVSLGAYLSVGAMQAWGARV